MVPGCRFTDSEQQRLFQAIQLYVTMFSSGTPEPDCPALQLVEDALKMPFTGVLRMPKREYVCVCVTHQRRVYATKAGIHHIRNRMQGVYMWARVAAGWPGR